MVGKPDWTTHQVSLNSCRWIYLCEKYNLRLWNFEHFIKIHWSWFCWGLQYFLRWSHEGFCFWGFFFCTCRNVVIFCYKAHQLPGNLATIQIGFMYIAWEYSLQLSRQIVPKQGIWLSHLEIKYFIYWNKILCMEFCLI